MRMRRSLVLTDESARHPFLASLPPHVRRGCEPVRRKRWTLTAQDGRDFLMTYCASFLAASVFLF
jgi:hypothetical protein